MPHPADRNKNLEREDGLSAVPPIFQSGVPIIGKTVTPEQVMRKLQIVEQNQILLQKQIDELLNASRQNAIRTACWEEAWEEVMDPDQRQFHYQHLERILESYKDGTHPNLQREAEQGLAGDPPRESPTEGPGEPPAEGSEVPQPKQDDEGEGPQA